MPRKKSAAKKAREDAKKLEVKSQGGDSANKPLAGTANEDFSGNGSEDSSSEEEDDYGELVTDEVESGINQVLAAIKSNDKALFDPSVRFFEDPDKSVGDKAKKRKEKPMYLKDYHRMNILSGETFKNDEEGDTPMGTVDGKQSFVAQQSEEKSQLLNEIKDQFKEADDEDVEDDDFLVQKKPTRSTKLSKKALPDPEVNDEDFLQAFVGSQAWIPQQGDKVINLDGPGANDDEEEFEDAAEQFENAYNFRYEDPNAAEIVSYARNQATLRRSENTARRRKRDEEKREVLAEKEEKETAIQKKKTEKVNKLTDVLEQVKKEYGADIDEAMVKKLTSALINGDFKDDQWDSVVGELFNEEYYNQESKPTWDEDDEIMGEFYTAEQEHSEDEEEPLKKKSKKQKKEEKSSKKREKRKLPRW
ncbi:LADA_0G01948g1_1 [Lachancea dasiensis]|uniref:LADA_0G01948g1_1 n=1 Tax=Lachancea dasiensis TaxID=1072105 RepID=A0A1G4JQY1_9SACH|nr:LADA_0G01948g1_1 [Lachancea dasiensis]